MIPFDLRLWKSFAESGGDVSVPAIIDQVSVDSRIIFSSHTLFVALSGKTHNGHFFLKEAADRGARYALVNENEASLDHLRGIILLKVKDPLLSLQELAGLYRKYTRAKVIAITGSYGKTMLKDLIFKMIKNTLPVMASPESFNSQIGVPLSLFTIKKEDSIALIEVGISNPGEMQIIEEVVKPDHGILTNIGDAHLSTLYSLENIAKEKMILFQNISKENWVLLPNDTVLFPYRDKVSAQWIFWDYLNRNFPYAEMLDANSYSVHFPSGESFENNISEGMFYFLDLLNIAMKAAWILGVGSETIKKTLLEYNLEPIRTEIWRAPSGVVIINEPYCSHPLSVGHSLKTLENNKGKGRSIFVFGGFRDLNLDYEESYKAISNSILDASIDFLILLGNHNFSSLIEKASFKAKNLRIAVCQNISKAIELLKEETKLGDTILIKGSFRQSWEKISEVFLEGESSNKLSVNLSAVQSNLEMIRSKFSNNMRIMAMVKASAYGTDNIILTKFLKRNNIDIFGVANVDEAISLRKGGIDEKIFVINSAHYEANKIVKWNLEVGISDNSFVEILEEKARQADKIVKVHLHVDTGMSRFGCRPEESIFLARKIHSSSFLKLEGIMTHYACAESSKEDSFTLSQMKTFKEVIELLRKEGIRPPYKHAMNSSGSIRFFCPELNMVRIGLALFGIHASPETRREMQLKPAISLTSRIVGLNICKRGETVSYGRNYTVERKEENIAIIPIGYFDGIHQHYSGKGFLNIRGVTVPMVGTICMDFMMIDVTYVPKVSIGEEVLIFGEDKDGNILLPEIFAQRADANVYELISCLGSRIHRVFILEEKNFERRKKS